MPPHLGHHYLVSFARSFSRDLTVFVCTLPDEPIPGELRYQWMKTLFPNVEVIHVTEAIPEASRSAEGAQEIWADAILERLSSPPAYVFASESYGVDLARALGARFVPVDPRRSLFPISAGMIRDDPMDYWDYIPPIVRPYFARRVSVTCGNRRGQDQTAVHTLARDLAAQFRTVYVSDYAAYRNELAFSDPTINSAPDIVRAQMAAETALLEQANRVLFRETDILQLILASPDEDLKARFRDGAYDEEVSRTRPDLVISIGAPESEYRREIEQRGWTLHEIDPDGRNLEMDAATAVREMLSRR